MALLKKKRACVVVLGDIGRSPRMQYHVQSLLEDGFDVDMIGYVDTQPLNIIQKNVIIRKLTSMPELNFPRTVNYMFKTLWQTLSLLIALSSMPIPQFVLCQNPPAIPTLVVCYLYCAIMRCKFIIDWHNYAHTIMALTSSPQSLLVKFAKKVEVYFGRKSAANLCVTKAMKADLMDEYGIEATVLYDRPPDHFAPITLEDKHKLYRKLQQDYIPFNVDAFNRATSISGASEETNFTQKINGTIQYKLNRPGILISSTSWTPDEDFSLLIEALEDYEKSVEKDTKHYPDLVVVITGKGPLKSQYIDLVMQKNWKHVKVTTPWLESEDYPLMLASADLGVCLHWSSSGLDLPMKIVDMYGCGLPVCAVNFKCLNELVEHGKNGFIFEKSAELAEQIKTWFYGFPDGHALFDTKQTFKENLKRFQTNRWKENWKTNALPFFK